jgi:hypothetical protein
VSVINVPLGPELGVRVSVAVVRVNETVLLLVLLPALAATTL